MDSGKIKSVLLYIALSLGPHFISKGAVFRYKLVLK